MSIGTGGHDRVRRAGLIGALGALALALTIASSSQAATGIWERSWGKDVLGGGVFEVCTVAASCQGGSTGILGGEMNTPQGVATDASGNVYVADGPNHRIQRFDSAGNFERAWGRDVVSAGPGEAGTGFEICVDADGDTCKQGLSGFLGGEMNNPAALAIDASGNVYVADQSNVRIQKFDSAGNFERAWGKDVLGGGVFEVCAVAASCQSGSPGSLGGEMFFPQGVTTGASGNVYVSDAGYHRIQKFDPAGGFERAWGRDVVGAGPGNSGTGGFEICVDADGDTCKAGASGAFGGEMSGPTGLATDASEDVFVADQTNNRIQRFDSAGNFERAWGKDVVSAGPGEAGTGYEICVDADGDTCQIGTPGVLGGEMVSPRGVATEGSGDVYVAEPIRHRIQKFDPDGNWERAWGKDVLGGGVFEVCTVAASCQSGSPGSLGGEMNTPQGVASDASGNAYVPDSLNHRIQKFPADADLDGLPDATDNCPTVANANQANLDGDALGDACDPDDDNDGVADGTDNCPTVSNATQEDNDRDGLGNACDSTPLPTNDFKIDRLKRKTSKGIALLFVTVPGPGEIALQGKGIRQIGAAGLATAARFVEAGRVKLVIRAKGKQAKTLRKTGKVKLKAKITYAPTGGEAATQSRKLKLKLKR